MQNRMLSHGLFYAVLLAFASVVFACPIAAQTPAPRGTTISGRILDAQSGLPVTGAMIELDRNGSKIAMTQTDGNGNFAFAPQPPGIYSFIISGVGYQTSRAPDIVITADEGSIAFQSAIARAAIGLPTIAYVATAGRSSLQTTTTINEHVDTSLLQSENFQRLADVLTTVPGVTTSTSSSAGDDMTLSIRGFNDTETATLLDGHPIGPVGAGGQGYNYNVSPFWGLSGTDVIFGSGATGLFGATTIAGAVDFETVNPTLGNHVSVTQAFGSDNKSMTGILATGTDGRFGYAIAWGSQGTTGNFPGADITQRALLQVSVINPGYLTNAPPPDLTRANVFAPVNTYFVSGEYSQKNFLGKLRYDFSPTTHFQVTSYAADDWSSGPGNGDNDFETYPYVLYGAQHVIARGPNTILVHGVPQTCTNSIAVLVDASPGYECMSATQYASNFYGPFGGSIDRWRTLGNQDTDERLTQQFGISQITLEAFQDAYNYNEQKGPGAPIDGYGPGPYYLFLFHNRGYLISDEIPMPRNDLSFGYTWLHQSDTNGSFPYTLSNGTRFDYFGNNSPLYLATASYFARDTWTPNEKLSVFGTFWLQRSLDTAKTELDPRFTIMYRPDSNDVIRFSTGRSYSEPDPSLIALQPPVYGAPSSLNCPQSTSGTGALTSVASVANPGLKPETADDLELAYGHRFTMTTSVQADVYQSWESGALLSGLVPIVGFPGITVPASYINQALLRLSSCPGLIPTINNLGFSTTYNASGARYRGIVLNANVGIMRNVTLNAAYNVESAAYIGIAQDILRANTGLLDGGQIYGIPLRQGNLGLAFQDPAGLGARIDATYVGSYNSWNRGPFWFADGGVSQTWGRYTLSFGVNNIFNSAAQQYGLIGLGIFEPQNFYGSAAQGGPTSAIQEGREEYGILPRQIWVTLKIGT